MGGQSSDCYAGLMLVKGKEQKGGVGRKTSGGSTAWSRCQPG